MNKVKTFLMNQIEKISTSYFKIVRFIDKWIYPGYFLKNMILKRHDLIKLPQIKAWEYFDCADKMKFGVFEVIKNFIENEDPEKYICWYKDSDGNDVGRKYGDWKDMPVMFPELKGEYVMDLIKEIYNFYIYDLPQLEADRNYLLDVHSSFVEELKLVEENGMHKLKGRRLNFTLESPEIQRLDWDTILKYIDKKENLFENRVIFDAVRQLEIVTAKETQYYLHLAIEIRDYLWT